MEMQDNHVELEIAIVLDSDGDYRVAGEVEAAQELYNEDVAAGKATEVLVIKLRKRLPKAITAEISATLPQSDDGSYRLEVQQS